VRRAHREQECIFVPGRTHLQWPGIVPENAPLSAKVYTQTGEVSAIWTSRGPRIHRGGSGAGHEVRDVETLGVRTRVVRRIKRGRLC